MSELPDAQTGLFLRLSTDGIQRRFVFYSASDRFHQPLAITEVEQGDSSLAHDEGQPPFRIVWKYTN